MCVCVCVCVYIYIYICMCVSRVGSARRATRRARAGKQCLVKANLEYGCSCFPMSCKG